MKIIRIKLKGALLQSKVGLTRVFNFIKFLFPKFATCVSVYFLRKTNTFIKSKYSKNRQWSKSIVYFGLWFGVISAFAISYYTYRFLFTLSYLWWAPATTVSAIRLIHVYKNRRSINFKFIAFWSSFF